MATMAATATTATTIYEFCYDERAYADKKKKSYGRDLVNNDQDIVDEIRRRVEASPELKKGLGLANQTVKLTLADGDVLDILVVKGSFCTSRKLEFVPVEAEEHSSSSEDSKESSSVKGKEKEEEKSLEKRLKEVKPYITVVSWVIGAILLAFYTIPFFCSNASKVFAEEPISQPMLVNEQYSCTLPAQGPDASSIKVLTAEEKLERLGY